MITEKSIVENRYLLIDKISRTDRHNIYYGCEAQLSENCISWEAVSDPVAFAIKNTFWIGQDQRLIREANTLAQLAHPNIVQYIDHCEKKHDSYIVMEYVPETIENIVKEGKVTQEIITSYIEQIADVLNYFNDLNISHCDLSPENIGFNQGQLKVFDFDHTAVCFQERNTLPQEKIAIHDTPESKQEIITPTSDTYCAGRVLEYLITGKISSSTDRAIETMQHKHPRLPRSFVTLYNAMTNEDYFERPTRINLQRLVKNTLDDFRTYQPMNLVLSE